MPKVGDYKIKWGLKKSVKEATVVAKQVRSDAHQPWTFAPWNPNSSDDYEK